MNGFAIAWFCCSFLFFAYQAGVLAADETNDSAKIGGSIAWAIATVIIILLAIGDSLGRNRR